MSGNCKGATGGAVATYFGVPASDFAPLTGTPKSFSRVAGSGRKPDRAFRPDLALARLLHKGHPSPAACPVSSGKFW